jgi:hypothetical protein
MNHAVVMRLPLAAALVALSMTAGCLGNSGSGDRVGAAVQLDTAAPPDDGTGDGSGEPTDSGATTGSSAPIFDGAAAGSDAVEVPDSSAIVLNPTLGAAALNRDGRLEIFAVTYGGGVVHRWQLSTGGWSGWAYLGPTTGPTYGLSGAATNIDGRVEVFGVTSEAKATHAWQTSPGGSWTGWATLEINFGFVNGVGAALDAHHELEVYTLSNVAGGPNQLSNMWFDQQVEPGGAWSGYSEFVVGDFLPGGGAGVARNHDGRIEVFGIGLNSQMYHAWQTDLIGDWHGFVSLGGGFESGAGAAANADGRLEVFGVGFDDQMYHAWQTTAGGAWTGWHPMGGLFLGGSSVAANVDGRLEVFGVGLNNQMYHAWQVKPGGAWSAWALL